MVKQARVKKNEAVTTKKSTLDQKHTERLESFEKNNNELPIKKLKLQKMVSELNSLSEINSVHYSSNDVRRKSYLIDAIEKLEKEIYEIENCTESLNYISKTLSILVDYYDNDALQNDHNEELVKPGIATSGKRNILSYFITETPEQKPVDTDATPKLSRANLYDSYQRITDINYKRPTKSQDVRCTRPGCTGTKFLCHTDGYMVCQKCGLSDEVLVPTDKPSYKEPTQDPGITLTKG